MNLSLMAGANSKLTPSISNVDYSGGNAGINALSDVLEWLGIGTSRANREFNSQEALRQREFEEIMSNTAYQRAVADMKAAGLNPALMYASGGNQASTPSGGTASSGSSGPGKAMDLLGSIASIINSVNGARNLDLKSRGLDLKAKHDTMTSFNERKIYNSAGNLLNKIVTEHYQFPN